MCSQVHEHFVIQMRILKRSVPIDLSYGLQWLVRTSIICYVLFRSVVIQMRMLKRSVPNDVYVLWTFFVCDRHKIVVAFFFFCFLSFGMVPPCLCS